MVHVPYKGEPQAITDLVAAACSSCSHRSTTSVPQVRDGKLRALVTTLAEAQRAAARRADDRRGRHAEVLHHFVGRAVRAGEAAGRRASSASTGSSSPPWAARRAGGDGQAGLRALAVLARAARRAFVKEQMESYRSILRAAGVQPE